MVFPELTCQVTLGSGLFNAGLNSLKAMQLARTIRTRMIPPEQRSLTKMDQNVIYEQSNLKKLATYLDRSLHGDAAEADRISHTPEEVVQEKTKELISRHSNLFVAAIINEESVITLESSTGPMIPFRQNC